MDKLLETLISTPNGLVLLLFLSPTLAMGVFLFLTYKYGYMGHGMKRRGNGNGADVVKGLIETANGDHIKRPEWESHVQASNATLSGIRKEMRAMVMARADMELKLSERIARLEERKKK